MSEDFGLISPLAVISAGAVIAEGVRIGPWSMIGPGVRIGRGTQIASHVVITGETQIGEDCRIFQFASIGEAPQDLGYRDEPTRTVIGDRCQIRENVTIHRGTVKGGGLTQIGSDNLIMAYCHVAHDCLIGSRNIFSNAASLAGHVVIEDDVTLGGFTLVHQFCRVGSHAFTSMGCALNRDLTPFTLASGNYARAIGINKVGLRRKGFSAQAIEALQKMFRLLVRERNVESKALAHDITRFHPEAAQFFKFVGESKRGIVRTRGIAHD